MTPVRLRRIAGARKQEEEPNADNFSRLLVLRTQTTSCLGHPYFNSMLKRDIFMTTDNLENQQAVSEKMGRRRSRINPALNGEISSFYFCFSSIKHGSHGCCHLAHFKGLFHIHLNIGFATVLINVLFRKAGAEYDRQLRVNGINAFR